MNNKNKYRPHWHQPFLLFSAFASALMMLLPSSAYSIEELENLAEREALSQSVKPENLDSIWKKALIHRDSVHQTQQEQLKKLDRHRPQSSAVQTPQVIVFASLGMPRTSLHQLVMQADQYQVPVVIRGVLPEGFKATVNTIHKALANENQIPNGDNQPVRGGIAIDPNWFRTFGIKQVPAFVVVKEGACSEQGHCSSYDFDVLYGNIPLPSALEIIATE